jgi:FkbM family methyltransferase
LARWIDQMQACLGIGAGGTVASSGEKIIFESLQKRSNPSYPLCIFDVGSNQGQFLGLIDQCLTRVPHAVHCFEPSPSTFKMLWHNFGERPNTTFNPFGLGKTCGEFDLFSDAAGSGLASLSERRLQHFGIDFTRREQVRISTLDAYCAEHGTRMFAEHRVGAVTFEFGGCNIDSRTFFQDFYYFFNLHGMSSIFRILPFGALERISSYQENLEQFRTTNFLVFREDLTSVAQTA